MERLLPSGVHLLNEGYVGSRVASTVGLVIDGDSVIVIDPGMVSSKSRIIDPLAGSGFTPEQVTDVVLSHHHPDHTMNAGLFPNAWVHDHWARYRDDGWDSRPADGHEVSPSVRLMATPGHTPEDISTVVTVGSAVAVFTHLWWHEDGPPEDPLAVDPPSLHRHRSGILEIASVIIPGHGPPFRPTASTPR